MIILPRFFIIFSKNFSCPKVPRFFIIVYENK